MNRYAALFFAVLSLTTISCRRDPHAKMAVEFGQLRSSWATGHAALKQQETNLHQWFDEAQRTGEIKADPELAKVLPQLFTKFQETETTKTALMQKIDETELHHLTDKVSTETLISDHEKMTQDLNRLIDDDKAISVHFQLLNLKRGEAFAKEMKDKYGTGQTSGRPSHP